MPVHSSYLFLTNNTIANQKTSHYYQTTSRPELLMLLLHLQGKRQEFSLTFFKLADLRFSTIIDLTLTNGRVSNQDFPLCEWVKSLVLFRQSCWSSPNRMHFGSGRIINSEGVPFLKPVSFKEAKVDCDTKNFAKLSTEIQNTLDKLDQIDPDQLPAWLFYLDVLSFTPTFQFCDKFALDYFRNSTKEITVNTTRCFPALLEVLFLAHAHTTFSLIYHPQGSGSVAYQNNYNWTRDPCCNSTLLWNECCRSREIILSTNKFILDQHEVQDTCESADCTETYFLDYGSATENLGNLKLHC